MTDHVDTLARRAAHDLTTSTTGHPASGLTRLYAADARRRSHARLVAAAVVLLALFAGWFGRGLAISPDLEPSGQPGPSPMPHLVVPPLCQRDGITCLGGRTYRFALKTPVRWHVPPGFEVASSGPSEYLVESYWNHDGAPAGVSVAEAVRPSTPSGRPAPGFGASPSPRAFARWVASRPWLVTAKPVATTVGGRPAWRVRAQVDPNAGPETYTCSGQFDCHPVSYSDGGVTGIWQDMVADYTFVELPGSGTAMVWSWSFGHDRTALARNQRLVQGISWPAS